MLTTLDLLAEIKKAHGDCSDYRVAKLLGRSAQAVSSWQHRAVIMDDETALKAADLLGLDPTYVVLCIHAERQQNSASHALFIQLLERLPMVAGRAAAAVFAVVAALIALPPFPLP